ncbi:hypothetical protein Hanom_Chr11g01055001 [Helianthus anomalus]
MSSVPTNSEPILVPKITVTVRYRYIKVKNGSEPVPGTPKVIPNWYLRSFGSGNSVPVPNIICSSLTTGVIQTTLLPYNFFG